MDPLESCKTSTTGVVDGAITDDDRKVLKEDLIVGSF